MIGNVSINDEGTGNHLRWASVAPMFALHDQDSNGLEMVDAV